MTDLLRSTPVLLIGTGLGLYGVGAACWYMYHSNDRHRHQRFVNALAWAAVGCGVLLINVGASLRYNLSLEQQ